MPIQSYMMMYFAGSGWQYGKRRISAMSNEQFNKLTPEELLKQHSIELKNMLPTLDKTLDDVTPLIKILVEQYGDFVREAIKAIPDAIGNIFQGTSGNVQNSQFGITQVRLDQSSQQFQRSPTARTETKEYWEQVARDAWKNATSLVPARVKTYPVYNPPKIKLDHKQFVTPKSQLSITEQSRTIKRNAGQSQKIERVKLIQSIKFDGNWLKIHASQQSGSTYQGHLNRLKQDQQKLVNLLARYQF